MAKLIDKDALVAEIGKLKSKLYPNFYEYDYDAAKVELLEKLENFLDTLDVKEVDLTEEIYFYIENSITGTNPIYTKGAVSNLIEKAAKYFFELGLKAK